MRNSISIVIPIFNEEEILAQHVKQLDDDLKKKFHKHQIILTENGSFDNTKTIARNLEKESPNVKAVIDDGPGDYGQALINGINASVNDEIGILEIDYLDMDFLYQAYDMLGKYDLIIGSKNLGNNIDQRGFKRKLFTWLYNFILKWTFNLKLTETHGLKVLCKSKLHHITNGCVTRNAVWPSEFVIRASRDKNLQVTEIPLHKPLVEIRITRINAMKRLKKTLDDILLLRKSIKN
jgi:glycosyltransferase involved in cell wall biosynthesis